MKKIFYFSVSLGITFIIFLLVAAAFLIQVLNGRTDPSPRTASVPQPTVFVDTQIVSQIVIIYSDGEECFVSKMTVDQDGNMKFSTPVLSGATDSAKLKDVLSQKGVGGIIEAIDLNTTETDTKYIKIDGEIFAKITDRYGGLVYNETNGIEVLLTGAQARQKLDSRTFTEFCATVTAKAYDRDFEDFFIYLCNNTENDLSFPSFYHIFNKEN